MQVTTICQTMNVSARNKQCIYSIKNNLVSSTLICNWFSDAIVLDCHIQSWYCTDNNSRCFITMCLSTSWSSISHTTWHFDTLINKNATKHKKKLNLWLAPLLYQYWRWTKCDTVTGFDIYIHSHRTWVKVQLYLFVTRCTIHTVSCNSVWKCCSFSCCSK